MFFTATWPREVPFGARGFPVTVRCQDVAIGRCETWLPIFCTIPTRPTYVVVCSYIFFFLEMGNVANRS